MPAPTSVPNTPLSTFQSSRYRDVIHLVSASDPPNGTLQHFLEVNALV